LTYRLLAGAEADIDRIQLHTAREWGIEAADRYDRLMRAAFAAVADAPQRPGSSEVARVTGVRTFPLQLARQLMVPQQRVGRPRHLVVYRVGADAVVEILGIAHDRMLLTRAARRMQRDAET
jgi:toxin ParE1/3/4